jgi:hypothetical protein
MPKRKVTKTGIFSKTEDKGKKCLPSSGKALQELPTAMGWSRHWHPGGSTAAPTPPPKNCHSYELQQMKNDVSKSNQMLAYYLRHRKSVEGTVLKIIISDFFIK